MLPDIAPDEPGAATAFVKSMSELIIITFTSILFSTWMAQTCKSADHVRYQQWYNRAAQPAPLREGTSR